MELITTALYGSTCIRYNSRKKEKKEKKKEGIVNLLSLTTHSCACSLPPRNLDKNLRENIIQEDGMASIA